MPRCECGSSNLSYDSVRGELVCRECGLVLEEGMLTSEAHYVRFTSSDHSMPLALSTPNPVNRIKVKSHAEKRLEAIYHALRHMEVPQEVRDRALWLAKKYLRAEGRLPVHSLEEFVDALAYLASRELRRPYRLKARLRTMKRVRKSLTHAGVAVWCRYVEPEHYLGRIIAELNLGPEVRSGAMGYVDCINMFTPATRAAVGVVLALQELGREVPYGGIAKSAGISDSTLWKARKRVKEWREGAKAADGDEDGAHGYLLLEKLLEATRS
jgi:transcription initiation factor TFIIIB Brf1 subunit/transcription initiation factor TFIIB